MSCRILLIGLSGVATLLTTEDVQAIDKEVAGIYAKFALLSVSDDINASSFRSGEIKYTHYSLPWQFDAVPLTDNVSLVGHLRANRLDVRALETLDFGESGIEVYPRWAIDSLSGGIQLAYSINESLTLNHGMSVGIINVKNRSRLSRDTDEGTYSSLSEVGILSGAADMVQLSPSVGMTYRHLQVGGDGLTLDGRLSWHELLPIGGDRGIVKTDANPGTWSLRAEYRFTQVFHVASTPVDILLSEQPGGFWGKGYRDIDFGFISETALVAEAPINVFGSTYRLRFGAGWLKNDTGTGMSFIVNLR